MAKNIVAICKLATKKYLLKIQIRFVVVRNSTRVWSLGKNARIDYAWWRSWYVDNLSLSIDRYTRHFDPRQSVYFAFWLHDRYNGHICMARSLVCGGGKGDRLIHDADADADAAAVHGADLPQLQLRVAIRAGRANWNLRLWTSCDIEAPVINERSARIQRVNNLQFVLHAVRSIPDR